MTSVCVLPLPDHVVDALNEFVMEDSDVRRLYEPSPIPSLYVGLLSDMLGHAPLAPCCMAGNSTPTIPACYAHQKQSAFPFGEADTDGSPGSNVYEEAAGVGDQKTKKGSQGSRCWDIINTVCTNIALVLITR
jgi:hypothetical protein